ncbi:MAG: amidase [Solirubrobacteraceae bacterium]|nr:amidase [Solirubrobacteraceae bacterium]
MTEHVAEPAALTEELRWLGAGATAARVRAGELTPRQTVAAALARIDAAQPSLNAFIRIRHAQALADAEVVAQRLAAGEFLPLAGVPIAVKDEVDQAGEVVTKGSYARTKTSTQDAEVLRLIQAAGAVIVGATRTPEFCLFPFTESDFGGQTRNPWDLERTPGGSSGGSAAAVAAGVVPLALGGDGGGSIRAPAAWCGLPGLMPTPGSVSTAPGGEFWTGMAVLGGFARSIADTALLYDVLLTEPQELAAAVAGAPPVVRVGHSMDRAVDKPLPQGGPIEAPWMRSADLTATALSQLGHDVQPVRMAFGNIAPKFSVRYLVSAADDVAAADRPGAIGREARFLARLGRRARRFLPWAMNTEPERELVEASLQGFDVLLTPTMPCAPPPIGERDGARSIVTLLRASRRVSFLNTWNVLGWPGLTVPCGLDAQGRPTAALLVARPGQERLLLQLGAQLEQARPWELGKVPR